MIKVGKSLSRQNGNHSVNSNSSLSPLISHNALFDLCQCPLVTSLCLFKSTLVFHQSESEEELQ